MLVTSNSHYSVASPPRLWGRGSAHTPEALGEGLGLAHPQTEPRDKINLLAKERKLVLELPQMVLVGTK